MHGDSNVSTSLTPMVYIWRPWRTSVDWFNHCNGLWRRIHSVKCDIKWEDCNSSILVLPPYLKFYEFLEKLVKFEICTILVSCTILFFDHMRNYVQLCYRSEVTNICGIMSSYATEVKWRILSVFNLLTKLTVVLVKFEICAMRNYVQLCYRSEVTNFERF